MELGFHVRPDSLDFRDRIFQPNLIEVPTEVPLDGYRASAVPILNQKSAWACTGFALATVVHYLQRRRRTHPDTTTVSPSMLFEMARRYDDYPGERYRGSSARGAMKGWHLHGVCSADLWPFSPSRKDRRLTAVRAGDAATRPLGAYYRVNHKDLVAMHCALAETGILFAVVNVHRGWLHARRNGSIPESNTVLGSHAIAIVAYTDRGFWIQNSWGTGWAHDGFGFIPYDEWLERGVDVWVARLGVPTRLERALSTAMITAGASKSSRTQAIRDLRPHLVRIDNDGYLQSNDVYGTSEQDIDTLVDEYIPLLTKGWKKKRILLYAGGGLVPAAAAVQRGVADYRASLLSEEVYPIAFVWRSGFWDTIGGVLRRALDERKPATGTMSDIDFLLDRLDDGLEPAVREEGGKLQWDEMKRTARQATTLAEGGVRLLLQRLARLAARDPSVEIHLVGHSAGAILLAPAVQFLTSEGRITSGPMKGRRGLGLRVASCTLWAPACTVDFFHQTYFYAIRDRLIRRFMLLTLTDRAEQADNVAGIYRKSLLYLISHALEVAARVPGSDADGTEIMGIEKHVRNYQDFERLLRRSSTRWVASPNTRSPRSGLHGTVRHHGDFDDDAVVLGSTLRWILGQPARHARFALQRSASSRSRLRQSL